MKVKTEKKQRTLRQILLASMGKAWLFWPPRLAAKARAKHPTKKGWWICEICKDAREKIEIDHIFPCIKPTDGFVSWDEYIKSRFVENPADLQAICHECHQDKTKRENMLRRESKKSGHSSKEK